MPCGPSALQNAVVTQTRELENGIPTKFFSEVAGNQLDLRKAVEFLERLENSAIAQAKRYLDLKNGTKLKQLLSHREGTSEHAYWTSILPTLVSIACSTDSRCRKLPRMSITSFL